MRVYRAMGYIIALVILVLVVPLLFVFLTRRSAGGGRPQADRGVTFEQPSSDEPTPGAPGATNQPKPGTERRIPPG